MSVRVMNMVFERYPNGGGEMLLALALADHSHDDGTNIYPSIAQLATKTRQSERSVQYQLRRMEEMGWIELVNEGDGGRGKRRQYRISPAWMKGAELAPIVKEKGADSAPIEKGATDDIKGANDDAKGCKAFAPTDNRKEPSKNHQGGESLFDRFWKAYPRKVGKDDAVKKFAKREPDEALLLAMLKAIADQGLQAKFDSTDDRQYVPHPATWLHQGRWKDEVAPSTTSAEPSGRLPLYVPEKVAPSTPEQREAARRLLAEATAKARANLRHPTGVPA